MGEDPQSRKGRVDQALRRVHEHPGYQRHRELGAFYTSIVGVFRGNFLEVVEHLDLVRDSPDLAIELVQNVRPPEVREAYMGELARLLHNYFAGSHSVVDHARRLTRDVEPEFAKEWKERVGDVISNNPVLPLVGGLRNFSLHRKLPFLGSTVSVTGLDTDQSELKSEIQLSAEELLEWDGWNAAAKTYIKAASPEVPVRAVIEVHGPLVYDLNVWLHGKLMKQNAGAVAEVNELMVDYNAELTGLGRDEARLLTQQGWRVDGGDDSVR